MQNNTLCPLCGEGRLTPRTEETVTEYAGRQGKVTLRFAECNACRSEITGEADSCANKRVVLAFRKSVDGLLTGAEIRALREKCGVTQDQAARLFGSGPKAFSKYEADDVAHSAAMDTLLRLAQRSEETFWELVALRVAGTEGGPAASSDVSDHSRRAHPAAGGRAGVAADPDSPVHCALRCGQYLETLMDTPNLRPRLFTFRVLAFNAENKAPNVADAETGFEMTPIIELALAVPTSPDGPLEGLVNIRLQGRAALKARPDESIAEFSAAYEARFIYPPDAKEVDVTPRIVPPFPEATYSSEFPCAGWGDPLS